VKRADGHETSLHDHFIHFVQRTHKIAEKYLILSGICTHNSRLHGCTYAIMRHRFQDIPVRICQVSVGISLQHTDVVNSTKSALLTTLGCEIAPYSVYSASNYFIYCREIGWDRVFNCSHIGAHSLTM
jgi:hypothetical protein